MKYLKTPEVARTVGVHPDTTHLYEVGMGATHTANTRWLSEGCESDGLD